MNLVKKEYLYKLIEDKGLLAVYVYGSDAKTLMFDVEGSDITPSQAANELQNFFDDQAQDGIYVVKLSKKSRKEKADGGSTTTYGFRIQIKEGNTNKAIGAIPTEFNNNYKELVEKNIALNTQVVILQQEAIRKKELDLLNAKIDALKNSDPLEKYAPLIAGFFNKGQTVNAAQQLAAVAGPEDAKENKAKIISAINRLNKIDPNFADTITMLADAAEKDPQKFLSFIPMIKSMM